MDARRLDRLHCVIETDLLNVIVQLDAGDLQHVVVVSQAVLLAALVAEDRQLQPGQLAFLARRCIQHTFTQFHQGQILVGLGTGREILEEGDINFGAEAFSI
ncbi:hypothetical protein IVA94_35740 [Bradyrhizobium sp. 156]|uniref:hypothetical protein n=1 Tax=Bradyrhizobium sp. 156 TaxID=2782630 RepID=UPI001FF7B38E|nr:hypothetical protein [Bradyrhizobium sp. 156]MCK1326125.1 hypothetical protein [Bradyrhizobium sp. 156]